MSRLDELMFFTNMRNVNTRNMYEDRRTLICQARHIQVYHNFWTGSNSAHPCYFVCLVICECFVCACVCFTAIFDVCYSGVNSQTSDCSGSELLHVCLLRYWKRRRKKNLFNGE